MVKKEERKPDDKYTRKTVESLGRKGYLSLVHSNPIPTLTISGMAYGAAKSTIRAIPKYLREKEIARLKDENAEYRERLDILEDYKKRMEESEERDTKEIKSELTRVEEILENAGRASGKLETLIRKPKRNIPLIFLGVIGLIISFTGNISRINGFAISRYTYIHSVGLGFLLLLGSLVLIYLGTKEKRKRFIQKKPHKFR